MRRDIGIVFVTALLTFAVAMMASHLSSQAVADQAAPAKPKLVIDGVELAVTFDQNAYAAGDKPSFTVTARNTGTAPVEFMRDLRMSETAMADWGSRMMPMPKKIWQQSCSLQLAPGETKTLKVAPDTAVSAARIYTVEFVGKDGRAQRAATLSIAAPKPEPQPATKSST